MKEESIKCLHVNFKDCKTEVDRWRWILANKSRVKLMLDNDDTQLFIDDKFVDGLTEYLGWSDGIFALLDALDIKCEGV